MLDRMLMICTTAPPPQDELADLLGSLQVLRFAGLWKSLLLFVLIRLVLIKNYAVNPCKCE